MAEEVKTFKAFVATQKGAEEKEEVVVRHLRAQDTYQGYATQDALQEVTAKVAKMSHTEFANLPMKILIVPNKPYIIITNIDVVDGIVDGAEGSFKLCERGVVVLARRRPVSIPRFSGRDERYMAQFPLRYKPRCGHGYERALRPSLIQKVRAVKKTNNNVSRFHR